MSDMGALLIVQGHGGMEQRGRQLGMAPVPPATVEKKRNFQRTRWQHFHKLQKGPQQALAI